MLECKPKVHSTRSRMLPLAKRDLTSIGSLDVTGGRHPPPAGSSEDASAEKTEAEPKGVHEREKNAFGEVKPGAGEIKKAAEAYGTNTKRPVDHPQ
ncbi:hypothetical protein F5882DRAFT_518255 [Hyaloscypha sp. PMI_1271]|nr:hypothetical protein F5882DRAFT_518255 [Hyaloscypha sp. PMI_1271]